MRIDDTRTTHPYHLFMDQHAHVHDLLDVPNACADGHTLHTRISLHRAATRLQSIAYRTFPLFVGLGCPSRVLDSLVRCSDQNCQQASAALGGSQALDTHRQREQTR